MSRIRFLAARVAVALVVCSAIAHNAHAQTTEWLCDASYENCRDPLVNLIRNETVGIDVAFWFMEDARLSSEIVKRWQAGVPVRVIIDQRALPAYGGTHPVEVDILQQLVDAGIPIRQRALSQSDILHWKMMLFNGQNMVEFSGANYSPTAFVPQTPYVDFEDEAIYFTGDPNVVNSFRTKYDDLWVDTTVYSDYANITAPLTRLYPIYTKDPELNFPQQESYANRLLGKYPKEMSRIDVIMFRITDERETNAAITALQRGIPVRLITDLDEYREPSRQWVSYNIDKLWAAGVKLRVRAHQGLNHQKLVLFYSQALSVFGSSNWTSASDNRQQEHNYFTVKPWIFQYFTTQFERKWCSGPWASGPPNECVGKQNPVGSAETTDFTPLPPDKPVSSSPANNAVGQSTTNLKLKWDGGYYAHYYDVYFGLDPNPPLYQANLHLGPHVYGSSTIQSITLPTLQSGTTYYWRIVSRTMAGLQAAGPIYSFKTAGTPPPPPPPPPGAVTQVIWASDVPATSIFGRWSMLADPTAVGAVAIWNQDKGNAKIAPALAAPANYFEATFNAMSGVPYHIWIRLRAQSNSLSNNSVHVQFSDSVDSFGTASYRIATTSSQEIVLTDTYLAGWGWADNSTSTQFGPDLYFAASGAHTIRVQQRTDGPVIDQIVLSPDTYVRTAPGPHRYDNTLLASTVTGATPSRPALQSPWSGQDIGVVGINGFAGYDSTAGTFTVVGGGGDAWGTADGMYFASQSMTGDGSLVARVDSVKKIVTWSRAGLMVRESLAAGSSNAFMYLSAGTVSGFQRRRTTGASTFGTIVTSKSAAPGWIRLDRAGNTFTGYISSDGVKWTYIGSDTVPMAATVYAGLGVTSASITGASPATFSNVTFTAGTPVPPVPPPPPPVLPTGWSSVDVGDVGITGETTYDSSTSTFTVKGAGKDIWGTVDSFRFAYRTMTGDGVIIARVQKLQNINSATKGGVMIRQSLDADSVNAFMTLTPGKGSYFQRRLTTGGATVATSGGTTIKAPYWVKLERIGNTFNGYQSADGVTWTLVGTDTVSMGATVYVGLAAVSKDTLNTTTAQFDSVTIQ
jgi:phosphatidylserine/phosphatidylglycerophosphate/cardiolipin synthase-like enzyme/regulation of enolase protein 1 (concanavalin A-like superfamily)